MKNELEKTTAEENLARVMEMGIPNSLIVNFKRLSSTDKPLKEINTSKKRNKGTPLSLRVEILRKNSGRSASLSFESDLLLELPTCPSGVASHPTKSSADQEDHSLFCYSPISSVSSISDLPSHSDLELELSELSTSFSSENTETKIKKLEERADKNEDKLKNTRRNSY